MANKGRTRGKSDAKTAAAFAANEMAENLAAFTLPDSLPCSEIAFPVLIQKPLRCNWASILKESEERFEEIENFCKNQLEAPVKAPFQKTECDYIKEEVFIHLLPALEECLNKAKLWNAFSNQRCFFNGLDWIVQTLWNNNPRYPSRKDANLFIFNMPWVRKHLSENPRPFYPKSWLWPARSSRGHAATVIQKFVRQYFVQREDEVQEMRDFWRKLEIEKDNKEMDINPFLAKMFASERNIAKK